jgi:hypothetical protein
MTAALRGLVKNELSPITLKGDKEELLESKMNGNRPRWWVAKYATGPRAPRLVLSSANSWWSQIGRVEGSREEEE